MKTIDIVENQGKPYNDDEEGCHMITLLMCYFCKGAMEDTFKNLKLLSPDSLQSCLIKD